MFPSPRLSSALLASLLIALGSSPRSEASVKFLAIGNPSAIRIQGETASLTETTSSWKEGKLTSHYQVPLDTFATGLSLRDRHMKEKYLETAKYPNAELDLDPCPVSDKETSCTGKLTLHGVSKPVALKLKGSPGSDGQINVHTDFAVKLSDYGIAVPKFANVTVAEDVQIQVDSVVKPAPVAAAKTTETKPAAATKPAVKKQ